MDKVLNKRSAPVFVGLVIAMLYLVHIWGYPLMEPDEGRYGEIPREMNASGDYITPRLNGVEYFEKPALQYWMTALSFAALGESEGAGRLFPALTALLSIGVTGYIGKVIYGRNTGLLAAVITATSLLYMAIGSLNILDMPLSCFITIAAAAFYLAQRGGRRVWYFVFYLAMALGVLTKGLVGVVLPAGVVFWYIIWTRRWRLFLDVLYLPGIIGFFVITVPWFWLVCRENPDFFYFFFIQEHFLRYATKMHSRYQPIWFFCPMILLAMFPWTGFLASLFSKDGILRRPEKPEHKHDQIYLLLWFGVIFVFFSLSDSKLIPYIVPCVPPLAILLAANLRRCIAERRWLGGSFWYVMLTCTLFAVGGILYSFHSQYFTAAELMPVVLMICVPLLAGIALIGWFWYGRKNYRGAVAMAALMAIGFTAGLWQVFPFVAAGRTAKDVSAVVADIRRPGDRIVNYNDYLQGMPFYLKERILIVNYVGELAFGSKHPSGAGWFLDDETFLPLWHDGAQRMVLVIRADQAERVFPAASDAVLRIRSGRYMILTNQ